MTHGVFYTDGSAKPSHGSGYKIGWGVHGYVYQEQASKPVNAGEYTLTTIGYIKKNKIDQHELVEPLSYINGLGSSLDTATNNAAELSALLNILIKARELKLSTVYVLTDSEYVKKGTKEWLPKWVENQWIKQDGQPVANDTLWKSIYLELQAFRVQDIQFNIEWIKAHDGRLGNVQADLLASIGCNYSYSHIETTEFMESNPKGYWKYETNKHPLLNFNRIYFNSLEQYNTPGHYYQADPGGNDFIIGKRLPETGYSVIRLAEPDTVIESVKAKQYDISRAMNAIFMIKIDNTHNKAIHPYISTYGKHALYRFKKNNNLIFVDDLNTPITVEINPTGLSLRAIDSFNFIEEILDAVIAMKANQINANIDLYAIQLQDITDIFYDLSGKKTELRPEFIVGYSNTTMVIKREGRTFTVPFMLGTDCPPRNNLKRLESLNPKVTLVTFTETENTFRYCTIIECDNAVGIYSNFFADKVLL